MTRLWPLLTLAAACSKYGPQEEQAKAPSPRPLPPSAQTLSLELGPMTAGEPGVGLGPGLHHAQASIFLAQLEAHIAAPMRLPAALLVAADAARPELVDRGVRVWSFRGEVEGRPYISNLRSVFRDDSARTSWSLVVTSRPMDENGCCRSFELAAGEAEAAGRGRWQLYDVRAAGAPARVFSVAYELTASDHRKLSVQVNSRRSRADRFGAGSLIVQEVAGDQVRLTVLDSSEIGARTFEWSLATRAGSYVDPDGHKVCWGGELEGYVDVACPEPVAAGTELEATE